MKEWLSQNMFTAVQRREVRVEHLVPPSTPFSEERRRTIPTVISGAAIPQYLTGTNYEAPEPCTLNVLIEEFYDKEGRRKKFPFVLQPQEEVVGYTGLAYKGASIVTHRVPPYSSILCVETRSRQAARRGFTCLGFYQKKELQAFLDSPNDITLLFRNELPLPVEVPKPFSPAQLWIITYLPPGIRELNDKIIIKDGEGDVTEKNQLKWTKELKLYAVHLGKGIKYFTPQTEPVPLEALEEVIREGNVEDIDPVSLDFSLTITKERVITNGCPVYLFPFHQRDMYQDIIETREDIERLYYKTFVEKKYMSITANAGLHNPGCSAEIIFENCARGRIFENSILGIEITREIFKEGAPFGVLMPLPFYDGSRDTTYKGDNRGIELK